MSAADQVVPPTGEVMLEALRWHPVPGKELPDGGTTVLVELEGDSEPTWLGWMDGASKHALVAAFLAKHYTGVVGSDLEEPIGTVTATDHHSLVAANMVKLRGTSTAAPAAEPLHTVSAQGTHYAEVRAFLTAYYGSEQDTPLDDPVHTVTTKPRFGLVTVEGQPYEIADIGMRMLQPRELYTAQGFPTSYIIDRGADGRALPKDAQVRMCGNSVCPPLARAIVAANYCERAAMRAAA